MEINPRKSAKSQSKSMSTRSPIFSRSLDSNAEKDSYHVCPSGAPAHRTALIILTANRADLCFPEAYRKIFCFYIASFFSDFGLDIRQNIRD